MGTLTIAEREAAPDARSLRLARRAIADYERVRLHPWTPDAVAARLRLERFVRERGNFVQANGLRYTWSLAERALIRSEVHAHRVGCRVPIKV